MKRKTLLIVFSLLSFCVYPQTQGGTQSSNLVQILDLSVAPVITPTLTTSLNDSVFIEVAFKINNKALVSKAIFLFGTSVDTSDVVLTEIPFINQGGNTILQGNNSQKHVIGYDARAVLGLTKQQSIDFKYLTVFVQRPNGQISNKLHFQKQ